ncbi:STYKc [Seminavis robusta]|uniref:STYKc n=1 Tax=Seminavis robusta TaxID=568900 RepID=A0A9N8H6N8_9STRA|nr:STYKc [Seminavis robusta]|eukprot:Sro48_g028330.1 STYKc (826) ;mRNA; r:95538-98015
MSLAKDITGGGINTGTSMKVPPHASVPVPVRAPAGETAANHELAKEKKWHHHHHDKEEDQSMEFEEEEQQQITRQETSMSIPGAIAVRGISHHSNDDTPSPQQQQQQQQGHSSWCSYGTVQIGNDDSARQPKDDQTSSSLVQAVPVPENSLTSSQIVISQRAQIYNPQEQRGSNNSTMLPSHKKKTATTLVKILIVAMVAIVFVVGVIIIPIVATATQEKYHEATSPSGNPHVSNDTASSSPTSTPLSILETLSPFITNTTSHNNTNINHPGLEAFLQSLPNDTLDILQRGDPDAAPVRAFQWMVQDPHLQDYFHENNSTTTSSTWRLQQRFALATLFFATDGTHWNVNHQWLDYNLHECYWATKLDYAFMLDMNVTESVQHMIEYLHTHEEELEIFHWTDMIHHEQQQAQQSNTNSSSGDGDKPPPKTWKGLPWEDSDHYRRHLDGTVHHPNEYNHCDENGAYSRLMLYNNRLKGSLPPELFLLTKLEVLGLTENRELTGSIPTEIGRLSALKFLFLDDVDCSGTLPSEIGLLKELRLLSLDHNLGLSSSIPSEIFSLHNLFYFSLANAHGMYGTLATEIGLMSSLEVLNLIDAGMSGSLPTEFGRLSNLHIVNLAGNPDLGGSLPSELGDLMQLQLLNLHSNALTGSIPESLFRLSQLFYLDLSENVLTGNVDGTKYRQMKQLEGLILRDNNFSGTVSLDLGCLQSSLELLDLSSNHRMQGSLPTEIGLLTRLRVFNASNMMLSATIPTEMAALGLLERLDVHDTLLEGPLAHDMVSNWSNLQVLDVSDTSITGTIPSDLCELSDSLSFTCSSDLCGCYCVCF